MRLCNCLSGRFRNGIFDNEDIVAEYDSAGTLLRSHIHGQGIDEPVRVTSHGAPVTDYYYLSDGLGSIVEIQDSTGNTVEKYSYDSFGNPTIKDSTGTTISQSAIGNTYAFTGREYDSETGLYYYRARYYDAKTGRFFNEDPSWAVNLYIYVYNNPTDLIDPLGLEGLGPTDFSDIPSWVLIYEDVDEANYTSIQETTQSVEGQGCSLKGLRKTEYKKIPTSPIVKTHVQNIYKEVSRGYRSPFGSIKIHIQYETTVYKNQYEIKGLVCDCSGGKLIWIVESLNISDITSKEILRTKAWQLMYSGDNPIGQWQQGGGTPSA